MTQRLGDPQPIKNLLAGAGTLAPLTKGAQISTPVLEKFSEFKTLHEPTLERMKNASAQFCADMLAGRAPYWLTLLGTSGAGKTMLARIISRLYRDHLDGKPYVDTARVKLLRRGGFVTWGNLATLLRDRDDRAFHDVMHDWFVALDDIGSEHATDFTNAKLFEFLAAREKKWTVITGNLSLEQVGQLETRIASRMIRHGSVVVDVETPDWNARRR